MTKTRGKIVKRLGRPRKQLHCATTDALPLDGRPGRPSNGGAERRRARIRRDCGRSDLAHPRSAPATASPTDSRNPFDNPRNGIVFVIPEPTAIFRVDGRVELTRDGDGSRRPSTQTSWRE